MCVRDGLCETDLKHLKDLHINATMYTLSIQKSAFVPFQYTHIY